MLRFTIPVERGNEAIKNGALEKSFASLTELLKPETAYFLPDGGERGGVMVFDMTDPAQIPSIVEPLFRSLDAAVEFTPVMNADDLKRGLAKLKKA